jgi:hypothetical protein
MTDYVDTVVFIYLAFGALGGIVYLVQRSVDAMTPKDKYDPWEEATRTTLPARIEPPISARKK